MRTVRGAPLLAVLGGAVICLGAWLPWMTYFAGLYPLRGVIGLYGRLLIAAGIGAILLGGIDTAAPLRFRPRTVARAVGLLGLVVTSAAVWLFVGVRELAHIGATNAMFSPRPASGLLVVSVGGLVLILAALRDRAGGGPEISPPGG